MKLSARWLWARVHRYAGLLTAAFLFLAGGSGAVIAFGDELDLLLNPQLLVVPSRATAFADADYLKHAVETARPHVTVTRVFLKREPDRSVRISVVPIPSYQGSALGYSDVYVDPYDGRILGTRQWQAYRLDRENLIPFLFRLHYALHIPGKWGVWLMGAVSLIWTLDCMVGFYLTLPAMHQSRQTVATLSSHRPRPKKKSFLARWSLAWKVAWRANSYRIHFDLHRAAGLWLWLVLFSVALSGVYLNVRNEVFIPVVAAIAKVSAPAAKQLPLKAAGYAQNQIGFNRAIKLAAAYLPVAAHDFQPRFISYMRKQDVYRVGFQQPGWREAYLNIREEQIYLDAATGEQLARTSYDEGTAADKFLAMQYPLHSGELFGLPGRILIAVSGLAVMLLSVTGVTIWWRRSRAKREHQARSKDKQR